MKNIFIVFLAFFCNYTVIAQPDSYSRDGAEKTAKSMKELFTESILFSKGILKIDGDRGNNKPAVLEAIQQSDKVIKEFETKVEEFIQSKPTKTIIKSYFNTVTSKANSVSNAIENAADGLLNGRSISYVSYLQNLYLYQAFIAGAIKIYPEALSLQEKLDEVSQAIQKYGSRESYIAKLEKNNIDWVKNQRMKPAVFSDPSLEARAKQQYEAWAAAQKLVVTKVHITSNWTIEKNILDVPLHKEVQVSFAIKKADGSCGFSSAYMRQIYEGGGKYSAANMIMPNSVLTVPCENLNK